MTIAGHTFIESLKGRVCKDCGKRWDEISGATKDDIGKGGWAQVGSMNAAEYEQIVAERDRLFELGRGA